MTTVNRNIKINQTVMPRGHACFCDLDLSTHHHENAISSSPNCGKYLRKFLFKSLQWFRSYQAREISKTVNA